MVSARKKKEKRKDFVKTKLKVGKEKAKANNHTDTSFVAKSIHLPTQSIASHGTASDGAQPGTSGAGATVSGTRLSADKLAHYLSLFKHHSASTRREAVLYVQNQHVQPLILASSSTGSTSISGTKNSASSGNFKPVLTAVTPLLTDQATSVRTAALDLLKLLPAATVAANAAFISLYIHAAMTSIDPAVRARSTLALDAVLERAAEPLCRVAFAKLLTAFVTLLGWSGGSKGSLASSGSAAMVVTTTLDFGASSGKVAVVHIQSLHKLVAAGLASNHGILGTDKAKDNDNGNEEDGEDAVARRKGMQLATQFLVPSTSMPYLSLALFAKKQPEAKDSTVTITEDVESRKQLLRMHEGALVHGLEQTLKEGGDVGRTAKLLLGLVKSSLAEE